MPVTGLRGRQVLDGDITRSDINTSTAGSALIARIIAGTNISITSTGADSGTGDVTINATGGSSLNGTGFVRMSGTTASYITGTSSQFVKADGSLDSSVYLTSLTDTLATVTSRGASTSTVLTFTGGTDSNSSAVKFAGYNQRGGAGYHGAFEITNTFASATNPNKFFRLDSVGTFQIVNSAYTLNIFNLTDAGALTVPSSFTAASIIRSGGTSSQFLKADGSVDSSTYITGNQSITLSGDATGSGTTAITVTLANSGVTAGTYRSVTVDAKGRVTAGTNPTTLSGYGITDALSNSTTSTQSGYFGDIFLFDDSTPSHYLAITNSANLTAARTLSINVNDADRTISLSGNLTVSAAATVSGTNTGDQTITLTGDVTGSGTGSFATTLANSGVTAGTYTKVTVDAKGRVTSGTTLSAGDIPTLNQNTTGSAGSLSDDSGYIRTRSAGSEANIDTYVDNGVRSISYTGFSKHLLSWNVGGSAGTIQQEFDYGVASRGWRIRNRTDNTTWSSWGWVVMTTANQGHISGTIWHSGNLTNLNQLTNGPGYITGYTETDTLATVTGRGNTTTARIGVTTSSPINFVTAGNAGTWLGGIQDATSGWSISNNGLGLKADDSTYTGIVLATGNGLLYFGRTQAAGVGTMTSWLEVSSGLVANFKGSRPQFNGSNLALVSELPTVNNGTLTLAVSGTGLSGSASFTANQSGNTTFTVTSNATSANTASAIVARDASGNFSAGAITSSALYGTSYSTLTSGAGTGTAVFDTITTSGNRLYRVIISGNPNAAGSGSYLDWIYGKLIIGGGYDGTNVVNYIEFVQESPMPRTLFGSGGGDLTVDVKFVQSNVEYDSIGIGGTYTVRFKISGYNSTNTGASTTINLLQIG